MTMFVTCLRVLRRRREGPLTGGVAARSPRTSAAWGRTFSGLAMYLGAIPAMAVDLPVGGSVPQTFGGSLSRRYCR